MPPDHLGGYSYLLRDLFLSQKRFAPVVRDSRVEFRSLRPSHERSAFRAGFQEGLLAGFPVLLSTSEV